MKNELILLVEEDPEGGYVASGLGESLYAQGDDVAELRKNVKDALLCHFADQIPPIVRLHFVRDEVLSFA